MKKDIYYMRILANNYLIVVVRTERGQHLRIISARKASKKERKQYEE